MFATLLSPLECAEHTSIPGDQATHPSTTTHGDGFWVLMQGCHAAWGSRMAPVVCGALPEHPTVPPDEPLHPALELEAGAVDEAAKA